MEGGGEARSDPARGGLRLLGAPGSSVAGVPRSTFYAWYLRYREHADAGLELRGLPGRHWNRILDRERKGVVDAALAERPWPHYAPF